jgi:hypothetical protein
LSLKEVPAAAVIALIVLRRLTAPQSTRGPLRRGSRIATVISIQVSAAFAAPAGAELRIKAPPVTTMPFTQGRRRTFSGLISCGRDPVDHEGARYRDEGEQR